MRTVHCSRVGCSAQAELTRAFSGDNNPSGWISMRQEGVSLDYCPLHAEAWRHVRNMWIEDDVKALQQKATGND